MVYPQIGLVFMFTANTNSFILLDNKSFLSKVVTFSNNFLMYYRSAILFRASSIILWITFQNITKHKLAGPLQAIRWNDRNYACSQKENGKY